MSAVNGEMSAVEGIYRFCTNRVLEMSVGELEKSVVKTREQ